MLHPCGENTSRQAGQENASDGNDRCFTQRQGGYVPLTLRASIAWETFVTEEPSSFSQLAGGTEAVGGIGGSQCQHTESRDLCKH